MVLRCTAEKISYLPRLAPHQWMLTSLALRSRLRLRSPSCIRHVPTSRVAGWNDFLRGLASPISPKALAIGLRLFQRFTARRASLGTDLVMNSQAFMDTPMSRSTSTCSQSRFRVSRPVGLPVSLEESRFYLAARRVGWTTHAVGAEILRFTVAFLRGLRSFSSLNLTVHPFYFFPGST